MNDNPPPSNRQYDPKMDAVSAPNLQPPKKGGSGLLWGCIGCAVLPVIILVVAGIIGATKSNDYDANNKYEAIAQCEDRIKKLLKAPSTARFDSDATGSGTWTVTGTVDAENSFGAMIRSDFQCTVKISGDIATTTVDRFDG